MQFVPTSRYRRATVAGSTCFFTVVAYRRQTILCDDMVRTALRTAIEDVRKARPFEIDAWVLMPDHLHCIWILPDGDADFPTRWMMIKRAVSMACRDDYHRAEWMSASKHKHRESTIWQRRFWKHQIRDETDFARVPATARRRPCTPAPGGDRSAAPSTARSFRR
jgi:putative transposase